MSKILASPSTISYFKQRVKAWHSNSTASGKRSASQDIDRLLTRYSNLDQYDTRTQTPVATKSNSPNYIEIKQGGITFRKEDTNLTINMNQTIEYNDVNILKLKQTIEAGLEVIAAAAKHDTKPVNGVSI